MLAINGANQFILNHKLFLLNNEDYESKIMRKVLASEVRDDDQYGDSKDYLQL